jgi:predicted nucleic acid-binding protein
MSFLLDTNVISEWVKPRPDPDVIAWADSVDEERVFLSVISLAEIRRGIELMVDGRRRNRLAAWLADELPERFTGRMLNIDDRVAEEWGLMMAKSQRAGAPLAIMDGFFAATAAVHGLTLVTRNVQHFAHLGIQLFNPWQP